MTKEAAQTTLFDAPKQKYAVIQDWYGWRMIVYESVSYKKCEAEVARRQKLGKLIHGISAFPLEVA
jgi:hypothetical protein